MIYFCALIINTLSGRHWLHAACFWLPKSRNSHASWSMSSGWRMPVYTGIPLLWIRAVRYVIKSVFSSGTVEHLSKSHLQEICIRSNDLGHPFKNVCIRSNGLITCLIKTLIHWNDLITRLVKALIHWNDLATCLEKTSIRSNDLVTRLVKTLIRLNDFVTCLVKTLIRSNDLVIQHNALI